MSNIRSSFPPVAVDVTGNITQTLLRGLDTKTRVLILKQALTELEPAQRFEVIDGALAKCKTCSGCGSVSDIPTVSDCPECKGKGRVFKSQDIEKLTKKIDIMTPVVRAAGCGDKEEIEYQYNLMREKMAEFENGQKE